MERRYKNLDVLIIGPVSHLLQLNIDEALRKLFFFYSQSDSI